MEQIREVPIDSVKPYENNPRDNDGAVEATANSIKEFGWQQPIVVDKDMVIIAGYTRLKAAERLGLKHVPIVVADLSEEQAKAYRLADNKTGELADWIFSDMNAELSEITTIDMSTLGFDETDMSIAESWDDDGSLDDYVEPEKETDDIFVCPECGHKGPKKEFKK